MDDLLERRQSGVSWRRGAGLTMEQPIRVLRVIARLNVGGPALHVSYLTSELADRMATGRCWSRGGSAPPKGRWSTLRANSVSTVLLPVLQREIAASRRGRGSSPPGPDQRVSAARLPYPHREGRRGGSYGGRGRRVRRPPVIVHTFHGHVLRGYFGPAQTAMFRQVERAFARADRRLIAVSPEVRADLVALESRRSRSSR